MHRTSDKTLPLTIALFATLLLGLATPPARAAGLLIADNGFGGVLEIKEHAVKVTINNGIAVTEVTQVFLNTENRQVEALYTFPVPRGASVANFSMWINGKEMIGEVLEKQRARQIYDSYKQVRRDPGLLEQTDYRTFEMRIFPIAPKAEQRVQIVYYQELDFDHDWARYVYPLATNTRKGINSRTTGKFALTLEAKSEIPIVDMDSPSHPKDFAIAKHTPAYYQASLETRGGDLSRDVVIEYHAARPRTGLDMITSRQNNEDGYFSLTLTAGEELNQKDMAMDYVFVQDISGSMREDNKLAISRKSLAAFIAGLGKDDRLEVLTFNLQANPLFKQLRSADDAAKTEAIRFLDSQDARGGTTLEPAVNTAYKYAQNARPLNVIILSDGLTDQSERATLISLIRSRPNNVRVFCIGVGNDVNRALLEQIANDSGGLAAFLSSEDNFERAAQAFRRKLLRPVLTDLKINIANADVYDLEPKTLPNLYHGMPIRLYGRYRKPGDAQVTITGRIGDQEIRRSIDLSFPKEDNANPQIERMWAWHKVDRLLKEADATNSRSTVTDEIVRLGEAYSIVTEYTSFIVLENDAEYQRWSIQRKNLNRIARDRASQQELLASLESMRKKAVDDIGPVASDQRLPSTPQVQSPIPTNTPAANPTPSRSRDINILPGGGGGGGAIDPLSAGITLALAALGIIALRKPATRDAA